MRRDRKGKDPRRMAMLYLMLALLTMTIVFVGTFLATGKGGVEKTMRDRTLQKTSK